MSDLTYYASNQHDTDHAVAIERERIAAWHERLAKAFEGSSQQAEGPRKERLGRISHEHWCNAREIRNGEHWKQA